MVALAAVLSWAAALSAGDRPAGGQERLGSAIPGPHIDAGDPENLGATGAVVRLRLDGALSTGAYDAEGQRESVSARLTRSRFLFDAAFGASDEICFGASLGLLYESLAEGDSRLVMGDAVILGRYQALDGLDGGPLMSVTLAVGRPLRAPGGLFAELGVDVGLVTDGPRWDLSAYLSGAFPEDGPDLLGGGAAIAPVWRFGDSASLSLELTGRARTSGLEGDDRPTWHVGAGARADLSVAAEHQLGLALTRTIRELESTSAQLLWTFAWDTDDGLLRLDDDGGPSPEPAEWETAPAPPASPAPEPEPEPEPDDGAESDGES
jgi:hypothetical protein